MSKYSYKDIFPKEKSLIGMIHLAGTTRKEVVERAHAELAIYSDEGLHGAIVENYYNREDVTLIGEVLHTINGKINRLSGFQLGINVLPNEYSQAMMWAKALNASFIQLDYTAGTYNGGFKLDLESYHKCRLKYPNVAVLGGVWPKYYGMQDTENIGKYLQEARTLSEAVVVTGEGTGKETPMEKIKLFADHLHSYPKYNDSFPLIIGAGLTAKNAREQMLYADGAIVGSYFKNGQTSAMVIRSKVKELSEIFEQLNKEADSKK